VLRMRLLAHFGALLEDVVLAGPDRDYVAALLFPSLAACRRLCADLEETAPADEVVAHCEIRAVFLERLQSFAELNQSSSTRVLRAMLLHHPPSLEAREITDKGSINQAVVLKNRAERVEDLYREPAPLSVLVVGESQ
jgi:feruloyl-CoA synthase